MEQKLKQQLAEAYNAHSLNRNESEIQDWKLYERASFLHRLTRTYKKKLLEIGAGPGKDSLFFQEAGLHVQATDLSPEMVEHCREKGLQAEVMSFDQLTFQEETFDAVWALNCLLHVPKDQLEGVLMGIKRIMKPGGLFYMGVYGGIDQEGVWDKDFHHPKRFFSFYKDEFLESILTKHFHLEAFHKVPQPSAKNGPTHFQGFILKK
ncbi:SAM-dependent methyltransferase [Halobacillus mangrovi]|uniref:SAM-dependent methyltransferase n=1 Tax=Halobacillus mangrovi TaxID=402384 RepID=A0A1W6A0T2_9BACI|nr:SAM-dependent methyltransferase [Halobacillus mangrovi]